MMFDTDVLIWLLRGHYTAASLINQTLNRQLATLSQLEILQGVRTKRELPIIKSLLQQLEFTILPLTGDIGHRAAIYIEEFSLSHGLRTVDALIAATATEYNQILCTANHKHFNFIPGLELKIFSPN